MMLNLTTARDARARFLCALRDVEGWQPDAEQQAFIDSVVEEILEREEAMQSAIDLHVKRALSAEMPLMRCPIVACVDQCGEPLTTLYYAHDPHGQPRGFWAYRRCPVHGPYWSELF